MRFLNFLFPKNEKELFENNKSSINNFEYSILKICLTTVIVIAFALVLFSLLSPSGNRFRFVYILFFLAILVLRILSGIFKNHVVKYPQNYLYLFFTCAIIFSIGVSAVRKFQSEYVSAVCLLTIFPILLLDRSWRVVLFCLLNSTLCIAIALFLKSENTILIDVLDVIAFTIMGIVFGTLMKSIIVKGLDANRILRIERNTDALTTLSNRRCLFENLNLVSEGKRPAVTGIFMIDIDMFKLFNDTYGHQRGDICLAAIGNCFKNFGEENNFEFYRYGGEEFCALNGTLSSDELVQAAEKLRAAVSDLSISFEHKNAPANYVTISIGAACFQKQIPLDYEKHIRNADSALYKAKSEGRNCVRLF